MKSERSREPILVIGYQEPFRMKVTSPGFSLLEQFDRHFVRETKQA